jgi:hypothetical protein
MGLNLFKKMLSSLDLIIKNYETASKHKAVDILEYELGEIEHIFGLLILGSFIGNPAPPMQITLDLLPDMEEHFIQILHKIDTSDSPLSNLASILDMG